MDVKPLNPSTVCLLSKYQVVSPWDGVKELVKNSVEAGATNVAVRVDLDPGNLRLQVVDDGEGVGGGDMAVIARQAWSSKLTGRGQALARIRRVAAKMTISSRNLAGKTLTVHFEKGRRKESSTQTAERKCLGTTVTISGFLWNMKVRRKLVRETSALSTIKRGLLSFAFLHPSVKFSLRNDTRGKSALILSSGRGDTAAEVFRNTFGDVAAAPTPFCRESRDQSWAVRGFVVEESHHNSSAQFVCVNGEPILEPDIFKLVNNAVKKFIKSQNKELLLNHTIFALLISLSDVSKLRKVVEECFCDSSKNRPTAGVAAVPSVLRLAHNMDLLEEFEGIEPLECTGDFMDFEKNEAFKHLIFTPCKAAGRISLPAYMNNEEKTYSDSEIHGNHEMFSYDNWENPHFECYNADAALFPSLTRKQSLGRQQMKLTKNDIDPNSVICQVDNKYIVSTSAGPGDCCLLMWDQHAVHERINLECLLRDWSSPHPLPAPVSAQLPSAAEVSVLASESAAAQCWRWGLGWAATEDPRTVVLTDVPSCLRDLGAELLADICTRVFMEVVELASTVGGAGGGACYPATPREIHKYLATAACRYVNYHLKFMNLHPLHYIDSMFQGFHHVRAAAGRGHMSGAAAGPGRVRRAVAVRARAAVSARDVQPRHRAAQLNSR